MKTRNMTLRPAFSRAARAGRIALALALVQSMTLSPAAWAGAYIFAGEGNGVDLIAHPIGYTGGGGTLSLGVCIDPASANAQQMVIPVQNNIAVWNELQPVASNVEFGQIGASQIDAESVLLHEMGHCIGLAHVNAASESGLSQNDYTKATDGANNVFDVNAGPDGVIGSYDDIRGDDVNLHWFNPANDPFMLPIPTPVDSTTYQRDTAFLPPGDSFAQNASRDVANAMGYPASEAVMQQGSYYGEIQRELIGDDAATILLAASGLDETAGTADDYQVVLTYEGITTGSQCDLTVKLVNLNGGLARCVTGGAFVGNGHARITSASIELGTGYSYFYNDQPRGGGNTPPVAGDDVAGLDEDGSIDIDILANDSDADGDPLDVTALGNPPNGSAGLNPDDSIRYTPDANFNGADSFSYTISDGNGGSDTANVSVTVNPVNDYPVAADDGASTPQDVAVDIDVLSNDSDTDGDALNVSAVGAAGFGSVSNQGAYLTYQPNPGATGTDSFSYTASDGNGGSDMATVTVTVTAGNQAPSYALADFSTPKGSVSGSYLDTLAAGGGAESVTETHNGGKPSARSDSLEHIWQFNLTGGNRVFHVDASGDFPAGDADSGFDFQWSTSSSGGWQPLVTVTAASSGYQEHDIGAGVSGTVYVRVIDTDTSAANTVYSTVSVDHMYFDALEPVTEKPGAASGPDPADGATNVAVSAVLSWNAGLGADSHSVYFGTDSNNLASIGTQSGTSYDPPGNLATNTTYYWRVDETNVVGTTGGTLWSFTTSNLSGPSEIVVGSIVLEAVNAGKGSKSGRATVTLVDDLGNPVEAATISGTFSGDVSGSDSAISGADGSATLDTTQTAKGGVSFTFCVDSVSGSLPYNGSGDCSTL